MKQYLIVGGDGKEYGLSQSPVCGIGFNKAANGDTRIKETTAADWSRLRDLTELNQTSRHQPNQPRHQT